MPLPLSREKGLNQQQPLGKEKKADKHYPNADFSNLCKMSDEEVRKDRKYFQEHIINNYFTTDFKKQFKVYRHGEKLCFLRNEHFMPLPSGKYGFIVSPKGGLYAIFHPAGAANPTEIQNKEFFHSLFRAGQPVQSAGFFSYDARAGHITDIFRDSGHYKPTFDQHLRTCLGLVDAGILNLATRVGKYSDPPNPPSFALGDIVNERVDYSAILDAKVASMLPPPPTNGYYAQASTEKLAADFKQSVEEQFSSHKDNHTFNAPSPVHQIAQLHTQTHTIPQEKAHADHVVIEIGTPNYGNEELKRKSWLEGFSGIFKGLLPGASNKQREMKASLVAMKDSNVEQATEETRITLDTKN